VETTTALRSWQRRIFLTCWLTYASFYLCRVNLSVALPAIQGEFGWSKTEAGLIGSAFFWVYACGQFINGQLGDRLPSRPFVAVGLLVSVALNGAFGFAASLPLMVILWGMNGYFQSTGWGPIVRTISHWFGPARRGQLSALLGPSYVLGHVASWLLAGWLVARWGWRAAFWVPAALITPSALHWMVRVRNAPQDVGLAPPMGGNDHFDWAQCKAPPSGRDGLRGVLRRTFAHPRLRWAALTNAAQGFVQGSAVLWVPTYLVEALNMDIGGAATSAVVLPLCGLAGVLVGGWASDRFFRSRVAPMTAVMMAGLAASVLATSFLAPQGGLAPAVALLGLIGAITHGVGSILVTVLPLSLGHEGGVSSAAGFLDFAGYVGAGVGGLLAGAIVDGWGWDAVFVCWAVVALLGLATTVPLRRSER
jgi:sugar phosphate permease